MRAIPLGCHSGLGSGAAQESFFWPLQEANNSAASAPSLWELSPAQAISKFHYSHGRRNEGSTELCHLLGENTEVVARSHGLYTQGSVIKEFLVVNMAKESF